MWCQLSPGLQQQQQKTQPLYLPHTGSLHALNEAEYAATEDTKGHALTEGAAVFAGLNNDN